MYNAGLFSAIRNCNLDTINHLLDLGAEINEVEVKETYESPLHVAARTPHYTFEIISLLLKRGAHINAIDGSGMSPLHCVLYNPKCNPEIIDLFLENGAYIDTKNKLGNSPLYSTLIIDCKLTIINHLLEKGADVNTRNKFGDSPICYALSVAHNPLYYSSTVSHRKLKVIELLLKHGAHINAKDDYGVSALHMALLSTYCDVELIKFLLDAGSDINAHTINSESPLVCALKNSCNLDVMELLLVRGADTGFLTVYPSSPLQQAIRRNNHKQSHRNQECVKLILKYSFLQKLDFNVGVLSIAGLDSNALTHFASQCVGQILKMDSIYIATDVTLRRFVREMRKKPLGWPTCETEEVMNRILTILRNKEFSLYSELISAKVHRSAMEKKKLMFFSTSGSDQHSVNKKNVVLDYDSVCKITKYLSDSDLLNLILAHHMPVGLY